MLEKGIYKESLTRVVRCLLFSQSNVLLPFERFTSLSQILHVPFERFVPQILESLSSGSLLSQTL